MIWQTWIFLILIPITSSYTAAPKGIKRLWNETWVDRLRQNLLVKYDKFSRPAQHYNTTTLFVYLNVMHVEVDSKNNILSVNCWVRMTWNDVKLKWDPKDYGGIQQISLGIHEVWQPDLYLYNSALHGVENYESRHCVVRQDGQVIWTAPTVFHSYCDFNYLLWPFETNTCLLNIGSWSHNGDEIDLKLQDKGYDLQYYAAGEWRVENISAHRQVKIYSCCPEPYFMLDYEIKLTRSSELYYHVIFVACIPLVFLVLVTFCLNPQSETKLLLNVCALAIDLLFLLYFGSRVPARIDNLPLIVKFFSGCLYQMTLSIIISGFVIHISSNTYDIPISRGIRWILFGKVGKYLGLSGIVQQIEFEKLADLRELHDSPSTTTDSNGFDSDDQQSILSHSKKVKRLEWILLATAVDRLSFILFCIIFIITAAAYIHVNSNAFTKNLHTAKRYSSMGPENMTNINYF